MPAPPREPHHTPEPNRLSASFGVRYRDNVYSVEIVKRPAMAKAQTRGRRGLNRDDLLDEAFALAAAEGEAGFSLRKLGARLGVDPMTLLHHFGSREGLLRAVADHSLNTVTLPKPSAD